MDEHKQGWFTDLRSKTSDHVVVSVANKRTLHDEKSPFQRILVFESAFFGKSLALDGRLELHEAAEHNYHEMMAFLALNSHRAPARVLVLGGGCGGVARECFAHPLVEHVTQCERDRRVVEVARRFFPSIESLYASDRLELVKDRDGWEFLRDAAHDKLYDVIIVAGEERALARAELELLERKLTGAGVMCCHADSMWFELEAARRRLAEARALFAQAAYASALSCTSPAGQLGFLVCSKAARQERPLGQPARPFEAGQSPELTHYTSDVHEAAFVLPRFLRKRLEGDKPPEP